ncbi:zinc-binding dehydrogenase family protein, putative [Ichthyophthirius multifiliis]|uniref:Zinc-binding dehydrogenase family protein, putative n=1 Tax=Ichthyophthirius multifiliis TaxID=5932 RepID=G0QZ26_ICHMU|nr:zinc-binding dehydrogenase family protein, putative [Ichthyophthirius multifiliis]EGR29531.1 zinc-binding dehydrogenase family protein, putative [Ichthyophthirius multifiliis]|eukprot:XP_004030767.1 zinc-binding dehydrogenase family protein, putative [Ichthyophthirius multifiliis]
MKNLLVLPPNFCAEQGACAFVNPFTSYALIQRALSYKSKGVLNLAANSSLGHMVNKLSKYFGLNCLNVIRGNQNRVDEMKKQFENEFVISQDSQDFSNQIKQLSEQLSINICFDPIGGSITGQVFNNLPQKSVVIIYGSLSGKDIEGINGVQVRWGQKRLEGLTVINWMNEQREQDLEKAKEFIKNNLDTIFKTKIYKAYSFNDVQDAIQECIKIGGGQGYFGKTIKETLAISALTAREEIQNIVRQHNAWIEDRQLYLVMEYCDHNLSDISKNIPVYKQSIFFQIFLKDSIICILKIQCIQTQLKPENMLYHSKQNKFKIADFGLTLVSHKDQLYSNIQEGDSRYIAQELLNYQAEIDLKKADIYSLGISIYQLLIGENLPLNGEEWIELRGNINGNIIDQKLKNQNKELVHIIKQMMHSDPEMRPSTQEILDSIYFKTELLNEIKWQKIKKNNLENEIQNLIIKNSIKRNNSL